jgi:hypothetical protein
MKRILSAIVVAALVMFLQGVSLQAAERGDFAAAEQAATASLPAALVALDAEPTEILNTEQAREVRGQWWINLPMNYGAVFFQGVGSPFQLDVITEHQYYPGYLAGVRITIGR